MSARPGNWQLLNHSTDPVGGDPARLAELTQYYKTMAETISSEAATLKKIGNGDTTELKGESADALRKRSHDVGESLAQASGRYAAVGEALRVYAPELDQVRSESAKALVDAEAADAARASSNAMADPSADRPKDAPPLTDQETQDVARRATAIGSASDAAAAARTRLDNALAALDDAGQRASTVIKAAWHDGLTDTLAYKIKQFFIKLLKVLVKVLMWIGVALAVLAFFIPGLAVLAIAGAIVAVVSLAASTALAAMGEGSWLDVILGAVSVLMLGAGALIAKIVQNSHIGLLAKVGSAGGKGTPTQAMSKVIDELPKVQKVVSAVKADRLRVFANAKGPVAISQGNIRTMALDKGLRNLRFNSISKVINKDFKIKPQFWNTRHPDYLKNDWGKIKDVVVKHDYKWDRLLSVDKALKYKELQGVANANLGIVSKSQPLWHYANGGRVVAGWGLLVHKVGSYPPSPYNDAVSGTKADLTTAKI
ncbi:hypothetical protein [Lacisediminihabitans sp.]|uniref:hypothetical protein n=1 Tax=Lacisediminihabitans sp. TaxID=2787631 RepID=UPI00374C9C68